MSLRSPLLPRAALPPAIPGLAGPGRASANLTTPAAVRAALQAGRSTSGLVVHIESDGASVVDRAELVASLRAAGVTALARRLERAIVQPDELLVYVDTDGSTDFFTAPLSVVLAGAAPTRPACFRIETSHPGRLGGPRCGAAFHLADPSEVTGSDSPSSDPTSGGES